MYSIKKAEGNALFLILIAVALFAALSYAVTQSSSGGHGSDKEKTLIEAAKLVQYAASVRNAANRIILIGGYKKNSIDFINPGSNNPNCNEPGCEIFNDKYYGVKYIPPSSSWLVPNNGDSRWGRYGNITAPVDGIGIQNEMDLLLIINFLNKEMCMEVNKLVGLTNGYQDPPQSVNGINTYLWYTGGAYGGNNLFDNAGLIRGNYVGCFLDSSGSNYIFYQVLVVDINL